ncbi:MAG: acyltransferase family protein [Pseudomonadota bacterium]
MGRYYDAIDGLRAVAVGLVLLFHAGFGFAEGGFIGVDVFFVISGFLITGIIHRDIANEKWSFSHFYLRRAARLLPALFVTLLATFVASYFILAPDDLMRLGQVGIYTAVSGSNIFFWLEAGYFEQAAASKPLLHTWSLGVEEQFYLLWPAVLFLLARSKNKNSAFIGLALLGSLSLIAALLLEGRFPQSVFFLTPFRIYQFALGGLIALGVSLSPGKIQNLLGLGAAVSLVFIAHFASGEGPYWLSAIAPAVAAALFIWSTESKVVRAIFASAPMVWMGRRSYSIYLVHWPIMVLWPMATDYELSVGEAWVAIAASVSVGALLQKCVEAPMRFKKKWTYQDRSRSLATTVGIMLVCILTGAHFWGMKGMPHRVSPEIAASIGDTNAKWDARLGALRNGVCNFSKDAPREAFDHEVCADPPPDRLSYLVIGDSYASGAYLFLKTAYPEIYFGQLTLPGCILEVPWVQAAKPKPERAWCRKFYKLAFEAAVERDFDGVVFAAAWNNFQQEDITQMIEWSRENNRGLVFLTDRPRFKERAPAFIGSAMTRRQALRNAQRLEIKHFKNRANAMEAALSGKTNVVNMYNLMCDEGCPIFDDQGNMIYLDASHLSMDGVNWLAARFQDRYPDLFSAIASK